MATAQLARRSVPAALNLCLLNWLIPGAGFVAAGDRARGITLFLIINGVLLTGVFWGGYVLKPSFSPSSPDFNLVAALTYIVQAFHGGGWLIVQFLHQQALEETMAFNLIRMAAKPFSDLGVFHLVVAGGLNYFATVRLFDLLAGEPELSRTIEKTEVEKSSADAAEEVQA